MRQARMSTGRLTESAVLEQYADLFDGSIGLGPPSRSHKPLRLAEDILRLASRLAAASQLAATYC